MRYFAVVLLCAFGLLQAFPQENLLLMHKECEVFADTKETIACYGPANAEELHMWVIKTLERHNRAIDDLTSLRLSSVKPHEILQAGLDYLPNLKTISLNAQTAKIEANTFTKLPHLEELFLNGNFDTILDDKALAGLSSLNKFWVSTTTSFNIKNVLKEVPSLTHIRIGSSFHIKTIEEDDFEGVPNLQELRIYDTSLSEIKPGALKNLKKLELVNIGANNEIRSLDENIFQGLHIKTLDLASDSLTSIPSLSDLKETLEDLDLSYNEIKNIDKSMFAGLSKLKKLNLSNNKITEISEDVFGDLTALEDLELSNNNIKEIKNGAFQNMNSLRKLDLSRNNLKELSVDVFPEPNNLEELYLRHNQITSVDAIKNKLSKLKTLE